MGWVVCWLIVMTVGAVGTVASLNSVRFARRVDREVREIAASVRTPVRGSQPTSLPPPVARYLARAVGHRSTPISFVRLRHDGLFRPSLTGRWLPIRGHQYFTADPPGFIWWGRVRMAPGVWIDARDRSTNGAGNMFVTMESTVTIADSRGPELDQGALLRLLGEMVWFPTVFVDDRYVHWTAVDDRRARATLDVSGRRVSGEFEFGDDALPTTFTAERFRDVGGGTSVLTPFVGRLSDFSSVDGLLVPHRAVGAWIVEGRPIEYVNFTVQQLQFDRAEPW